MYIYSNYKKVLTSFDYKEKLIYNLAEAVSLKSQTDSNKHNTGETSNNSIVGLKVTDPNFHLPIIV